MARDSLETGLAVTVLAGGAPGFSQLTPVSLSGAALRARMP